jgi:hypothetical protein|tara:strand:- start:936 stop:1634 length:699 start_codon:yes stop_codon:yes gene_type:complete
MKKIIILFLTLFISTYSFSLEPYEGSYDLYADTKMGNLKIGSAVLNLKVNNNQFEFTTEAKTESLWKALYNYSRTERSLGNEVDGQIINNYFSVIERIKDKVQKNYTIEIKTDKNYAVSSNGEEWEVKPGLSVDPLSVYLALANDMLLKPSQSDFTYQVVDQNGVKNLKFVVVGPEKISINDNQVETIKVFCDELQLTLNLSKKDSFQPVKIHKINGKTEFTMILIEFKAKT